MLRSISFCILQLFLYCKYVTYFSLFILISNFSFIYYVNNVVKHMEWERLDHVAILPYPFTLQNVRNSLRCGPTCFKPDFTCTFYAYLLYACNFIHMIYQILFNSLYQFEIKDIPYELLIQLILDVKLARGTDPFGRIIATTLIIIFVFCAATLCIRWVQPIELIEPYWIVN